jgi:Arc/MetJ family transcription regulator
MRTNIVLDDALVADAMRLGGLTTKREAVEVALREYVARKRSRRVLKLVGANLIAPDYDVRAVRRTMRRGPG